MNKIILFDIDYTLFNTTAYKQAIAESLIAKNPQLSHRDLYKKIEETYANVRKLGSFNPHTFAEIFEKTTDVPLSIDQIEEEWWNKRTLEEAIYPEALSVLETLQKRGNFILGIFSSGRTQLQLAKLSFLENFFNKDHIHIASFKEQTVSEVLEKYQDTALVLVDDYIEILYNAKKIKKDLFAIWMKRGKFAERAMLPKGFTPDATVEKLDEILPLVDKLVESW